MKRIISMVIMLCLGVFLFGCNKANRYHFVNELSVHNYEELVDINFEYIDGTKYVKYGLKKEGLLASLGSSLLIYFNKIKDKDLT